jgi:hypothetical protein
MLNFNELIDLRDKLANCKISLELATELYWKDYKEGKRSWHTKDWKERKAKVIKDKCEICSSNEILTIQHLSHPKKYSEYLREITINSTKDFIVSNPIIDKLEFRNCLQANYDYEPVPLCPNCKSKNPNERVKKSPKYRCADCKHEFEKPNFYSFDELVSFFFENEEAYEVRDKCFISKDKWKKLHNLNNVKYWMQREHSKEKDAKTNEREAFLKFLDDNIRYLSFEDTITACKKCAASYDLYKMELCPKCSEYYKGIQYPTCIQCLPEAKRKDALEIIEFGKEWKNMHEKLGIN